MIIHDYREITRAASAKIHEGQINHDAMEYIHMFDEFHLGERSGHILEGYLCYLSRKDKIRKKLSFNFMIHCSDPVRAQAFIKKIEEMTNAILKKSEKAVILTESQFLDKPAASLGVMEKSGIFAICDYMAQENSESADGLLQKKSIDQNRKSAWADYVKKCSETPDTCKIIAAPENILRERFRNDEHLYFRVFRNHIYIENMSPDEVYEMTLKEFEACEIKYSDDFKQALEEYIRIVYPKADLKNKTFADDLAERILTHFYSSPEESEELSVSDIPFYKKERNYEDVMAAMDELVGLGKVKEVFLEIPYMLQETQKGVIPSLHMAFVGNPGTGKTTVAQLAADLFYSMGVIRKNKVISVSALDLKGQFIGESSRLTRKYCRQAYGGILFIDEAYLISQSQNNSVNDQINQECIGTLLQEMENNRDRLIVIFAGYPKEMDAFLHESNSGLGSRLYKIIDFEDYSDDDLMEIFTRMCSKEGYQITKEAKEKVRLKLSSLRYSRDFGNARTVRNVYLEAKKEYRRSKESGNKTFEAEHIVLETGLRDYNTVKKELDEMTGLQSAKSEVLKTIETCRFSIENNIEVPISKHMLFLGNAGTGKSTVAKLFCQMLFSIGASKSPNYVSIAAGDLLGRYNPVESLQDYCRRASGGVLFIDEAYLIRNDLRHCSSCISVLLDVMEEERENITIILAGYEGEMNDFLDKNQGLKSRFPVTVRFEDYSVEELKEIFVSLCSKNGFSVSEKGMDRFLRVIKNEKNGNHFGNARTVRNIFEQSYRLHAVNFIRNQQEDKRFVLDDEDIASLSVVEEKKNSIGFFRR